MAYTDLGKQRGQTRVNNRYSHIISPAGFQLTYTIHVGLAQAHPNYLYITNHTSRLVYRNDPEIKWLPQSMYYM